MSAFRVCARKYRWTYARMDAARWIWNKLPDQEASFWHLSAFSHMTFSCKFRQNVHLWFQSKIFGYLLFCCWLQNGYTQKNIYSVYQWKQTLVGHHVKSLMSLTFTFNAKFVSFNVFVVATKSLNSDPEFSNVYNLTNLWSRISAMTSNLHRMSNVCELFQKENYICQEYPTFVR